MRNSVGLLLWGGLILFMLGPSRALAQAVSELPRAEYYAAKEFYGAGRTLEATEGFRAALNRARRIGEQRWVDSIPPLVMLGECYYEQGSLALALEQYDAALMLALANPGWINQIEVGVEQLPELEGVAKGINWFPKSNPSRSVAVPEAVQIAVDPTQAQVGPQGNVVAPISLLTRLDATEIFRTLAVALQRRWQVLGPLSKHSPLSEPVSKLFLNDPLQQTAWVNHAWLILRGLSQLSIGAPAGANTQLRAGATLPNQFDYFMTARALITLAELNAASGNYQAAIVSLQDAALVAAQFEQHGELSEALSLLSAYAAASHRIELVEPMQRAAIWCNKKSVRSQVAAAVGAAELAIYTGDFGTADKLTKQSAAILRLREVGLPRYQARLSFVGALMAFAQNRGALGISNLDAALKLMRGSAQTGAVVERVFQAQMTLDLLAGGAITSIDAESLLVEILQEPTANDWQRFPLKSLATITTASIPAYERLLELAAIRGDAEQVLMRIDRLQRQRLYEALPLGGRLLTWRHAVSTDLRQLPDNVRKTTESTLQRFPEISNAVGRIDALLNQLQNEPLPLDERQLTGDSKKAFSELMDLSDSLENQLAFQTLLRKPLDRFLPGKGDLTKLQESLLDDDLMLALAVTNQRLFGVAISKSKIQHWQSVELKEIDGKLNMLLVELGFVKQPVAQLPSEILAPDAAWRSRSRELLELLFPAEIQQSIRASKRVLIAPNDRLWYVPFELLPDDAKPRSPHWIERRAVVYLPSLSSIDWAVRPKSTIKDTVGVIGRYFSIDKEINEEQAQQLVQGIANSHAIFLDQKLSIPSSIWLRIRTDQLWVAAAIESLGWDTTMLPFGNAKQATLGSWFRTPQNAPTSVILGGLETSIRKGQLGNGNDIFLPACGLLLSGSETAIVARFPSRGKSSAALLLRYLEEMEVEHSSAAMRRAILAQWNESYLIADEPVLLPAGKESSALTSGYHPLLWNSYMCIGDTSNPK